MGARILRTVGCSPGHESSRTCPPASVDEKPSQRVCSCPRHLPSKQDQWHLGSRDLKGTEEGTAKALHSQRGCLDLPANQEKDPGNWQGHSHAVEVYSVPPQGQESRRLWGYLCTSGEGMGGQGEGNRCTLAHPCYIHTQSLWEKTWETLPWGGSVREGCTEADSQRQSLCFTMKMVYWFFWLHEVITLITHTFKQFRKISHKAHLKFHHPETTARSILIVLSSISLCAFVNYNFIQMGYWCHLKNHGRYLKQFCMPRNLSKFLPE